MKRNIQTRLMLLGVGCVLVTSVVLIGVGFWQTRLSSEKSILQVNELIDAEIGQIAEDAYHLIQSQDEAIQLQVSSGLNVLENLIQAEGGLTLGTKTEEWSAVNQITKESVAVQLPQMLLGSTWLGKVSEPGIDVPAVDALLRLMDARATIFQPLPDDSGILRVATNVTNAEGQRAIGTYIPAINQDGSANAVVSTVMAGKDYRGVAFVVDAWYVAAYHPVQDASGKVIAVLFVGVKEESVATLRKAISQTQVGKSGYISILGGKGDQQGKLIISQGGKQDGQSVWEEKDTSGELIYQKVIQAALTLKTGETTSFSFQTEQDPASRIVRVAYYAPWDWIILVNGYSNDYQSFYDELSRSRIQMVGMFLLVGLILAISSFVIVSFISRGIARPLVNMTAIAKNFAVGDIYQNISHQSKDEIGELADAFRQMISYMQEMAEAASFIASGDLSIKVSKRSDKDALGIAFDLMISKLRETASALQGNAGILENAATQLTSGADQVSNATTQIAATVQDIARGTAEQASSVDRTASVMENLTHSVNRVERGSRNQAEAVSEVLKKTNQISSAIQEVQGYTGSVQQQAQAATDSASEGVQTVEETLRGMQRIQTKVNLSVDRVNEMGQRSEEIGKIIQTIDEIASQTNLLALNATIEAARAGEHGKGFAVVADEVGKLAERSRASTKEIGDLIRGIQRTVGDAILAMEESSKEVEAGVTKAEKSGESLKNILENAEMVTQSAEMAAEVVNQIGSSANDLLNAMIKVSDVVKENTAEAENMTAGSADVQIAIENIANISQENSAAVEEVSASTEEVSAQMNDFRNSVQQLSQMAQALRGISGKFRID